MSGWLRLAPLALALGTLWSCSSVSLDEPASRPASRPVLVAPLPAAAPALPASVASAPEPAWTAPVAPRGAEPAASAASAAVESPGVAARFPDPLVSYRTPAFEPGHDGYTSNAELRALLHALPRDPQASPKTTIRLLELGSSQTGVPIEALHFSRAPTPLASSGTTVEAKRPTVLLVGQQHGDEPAGAEALIVVAQELAHGFLAPLLDRVDVVVLPRANPDGAESGRRVSASGIDINRDHLLLRTPEAQAQAKLARDFDPAVVVDAHEYSALGRYVEKFDAVQRYDALIQYATVANLPEFVTRAAEEWFRRPMVQSLKSQGLTSEWYYTTSIDPAQRKISMGGVQPDTGRNVNGLRNAVSFLIETRGIGLGRAHLLRRVHTQVTAITSILRSAALHADDLRKLRRYVDAEIASQACRGEIVVEAEATPSEYTLKMLDPLTGDDKPVVVAWDSALQLKPLERRARPCGYWLGADQADAVLRLRGLGVRVEQLDAAGALRGESYREIGRDVGVRPDVRGSIADAGKVTRVQVETVPALIDVPAGSYYVGLDQPLANLVVAALEPDTQSSYLTNGIITGVDREARVMMLPEAPLRTLP